MYSNERDRRFSNPTYYIVYLLKISEYCFVLPLIQAERTCRATSEPLAFVQFVHYVSSSALVWVIPLVSWLIFLVSWKILTYAASVRAYLFCCLQLSVCLHAFILYYWYPDLYHQYPKRCWLVPLVSWLIFLVSWKILTYAAIVSGLISSVVSVATYIHFPGPQGVRRG